MIKSNELIRCECCKRKIEKTNINMKYCKECSKHIHDVRARLISVYNHKFENYKDRLLKRFKYLDNISIKEKSKTNRTS
jgi:hypothetical protein